MAAKTPGCINFTDRDDTGRTKAKFGASHDRLVAIKRKYGPDNLLGINRNVAP